MTVTLAPPTTPRIPRGLGTLLAMEARLFLRDPVAVFFALAFPTVLLLGVGFIIPDMREPITDLPAPWAGLTAIDVFVPVVLTTSTLTVGLSTLPVFIATYREQGVLRRLSTTPMRPQGVLAAHIVINVAALVLAAVLAVAVAAAVFGSPAPRQVGLAVGGFVLAAAAVFGIGLVIAAVAPRGGTASGLGSLLLFPMMVFAGVWTPGPLMPEVLAGISRWTPAGAATEALSTAWFGAGVPVTELAVLAGYALVLFVLAARLFRWR